MYCLWLEGHFLERLISFMGPFNFWHVGSAKWPWMKNSVSFSMRMLYGSEIWNFYILRRTYIQIEIHFKVNQGSRCPIITIILQFFQKRHFFLSFKNTSFFSNNLHRNFLVMSNMDWSEFILQVGYRELIKKYRAFIVSSNPDQCVNFFRRF